MISKKLKILPSEYLSEDVNNLLITGIVLDIDDPIMNYFSNEVHVDLYMFGLVSFHQVSAKI